MYSFIIVLVYLDVYRSIMESNINLVLKILEPVFRIYFDGYLYNARQPVRGRRVVRNVLKMELGVVTPTISSSLINLLPVTFRDVLCHLLCSLETKG